MPFESEEKRQELGNWKEIAAYLKIAVRTAQDYEKDFGLPIHRTRGFAKSRVWAAPSELDAWKKESDHQFAARKLEQTPPSNPGLEKNGRKLNRRWLYVCAAGAVILLAVVGFTARWSIQTPKVYGDPRIRVHGNQLLIEDAAGRLLRNHSFPMGLIEARYTPDNLKSLAVWLGTPVRTSSKLIFVATPLNHSEAGDTVVCIGEGGTIHWQFTPGRPVSDEGGSRMVPPYFVAGIELLNSELPSETLVAVSSFHYMEQPNQVAFLNVSGNIVSEYWHPGHLLTMKQADLNGDGQNELLLAGVNNGEHRATVVVLDPWDVQGVVTPFSMRDQRFRLLGMAPAREKAVVIFPRSPVSQGKSYTRARSIRVTNDRLVVTVAEGPSEGVDPDLIYELGYDFKVLQVGPTESITHSHSALHAAGKLDRPYSTEDYLALKKEVIVRRDVKLPKKRASQ